ncbi:hypothetical protein AFEL58S_01335 [Afipia felis]|nr:DUF736 domain-containing protein [Afipia carboxidovorans]
MPGANAVSALPSAGAPLAASLFTASWKETIMPQIGEFTREKTGFIGRIHTIAIQCEVSIVPVEPSEAENAPNYRVHLGSDDNGPEIGAAWTESSEKAGEYLSLTIDAPSFPQPVRARLFQNGADATSWSLHWSRPQKRGERE